MTLTPKVRSIGIAVLLVIAAPARCQTLDDLVAQVSQDRIRAHLEALAYPRYELPDLERAAIYIAGELTGYGYEGVAMQDVVVGGISYGPNVIARKPGTERPSDVLVVGAHYDTVSGVNGADDNTSGVAGLLEIARILQPVAAEATIELVFFSGEEELLIGSGEYAAALAASEDHAIGAIVLESIGYTCTEPFCQTPFASLPNCMSVRPQFVITGEHIAVAGNSASGSLLQSFVDAAGEFTPGLPVGFAVAQGNGECFPSVQRSDHYSFWIAGIPAIMLTDTAEFRNPNYHQPTDTIETIDFAFTDQVTRAALATAIKVANGELSEAPVLVCYGGDPTLSGLALGDALVLGAMVLLLAAGFRRARARAS